MLALACLGLPPLPQAEPAALSPAQQDGLKSPMQTAIVMTMPRSGSDWALDQLNQYSSMFFRTGEPFTSLHSKDEVMPIYKRMVQPDPCKELAFELQNSGVWSNASESCKTASVFGWKWMYTQAGIAPSALGQDLTPPTDTLDTYTGGMHGLLDWQTATETAAWLADLKLARVKIINLVRTNVMAMEISNERLTLSQALGAEAHCTDGDTACIAKANAKPTLRPDDILNLLRSTSVMIRESSAWVDKNFPDDSLHISYEELLSSPEVGLARITDFLHITDLSKRPADAMTFKNSAHNEGRPMSEQIANPAEIEPKLVGTFWEGWLSKTSEETTLEACQHLHPSLRPSAEGGPLPSVAASAAPLGAASAASVPASFEAMATVDAGGSMPVQVGGGEYSVVVPPGIARGQTFQFEVQQPAASAAPSSF